MATVGNNTSAKYEHLREAFFYRRRKRTVWKDYETP